MPAEFESLTVYGVAAWLTLSVARDAGHSKLTKRQLIRGIGACKLTVLRVMTELEDRGWVEVVPNRDPDTRAHRPTLYALTAKAPHHSELVNHMLAEGC